MFWTPVSWVRWSPFENKMIAWTRGFSMPKSSKWIFSRKGPKKRETYTVYWCRRFWPHLGVHLLPGQQKYQCLNVLEWINKQLLYSSYIKLSLHCFRKKGNNMAKLKEMVSMIYKDLYYLNSSWYQIQIFILFIRDHPSMDIKSLQPQEHGIEKRTKSIRNPLRQARYIRRVVCVSWLVQFSSTTHAC